MLRTRGSRPVSTASDCPEMRYGGKNFAFFSRSGVTVVPAAMQSYAPALSASKMPLKSAPS